MTLLEKIDAYVASQGNQVGGGSEFADLLKEIVNSIPEGGNEPLIVEGEFEEGADGEYLFTPSGSITHAEAKEAFEGGRNVIVKGESASGNMLVEITGYLETALVGSIVGSNLSIKPVFWK